MVESYNPKCWGCIGPHLMTQTLFELAGTKNVDHVKESADVTVVEAER